MTKHYPIVFETEDDGAISAYVAGLPIYAQADTEAAAEKAITSMLAAYFSAHAQPDKAAKMKVARVETWSRARSKSTGEGLGRTSVRLLSAAALVGAQTTERKRASSRANGLLGGRPRKSAR